MILLLNITAWLLQRLPESAALRLGRGLGAFWWTVVRVRRRTALANLEQALGAELDARARYRIARASFEHLGANLAEFLRMPALTGAEILARIDLRGLENVERARARERGVVFVTAHVGHWEWLCVAQALAGLDITIVTRHAHDPAVDRLWQRIREDRGVRFLDSASSLGAILRLLRQGRSVGLIIDQHEGGSSGVRVDFFGRAAGTTKAPALLAARTGCPVVPVFSHRRPDGRHLAEFGPAIDVVPGRDLDETVALTTRRYNEALEAFVRLHPEQWLWVHRRWKPA